MEYKNYNYSNKLEVIKMLNTNNIIEAIIGAINGVDDQEWLEEICIKYICDKDFGIAKTAVYAIGDIARIYGRILNYELIKELFDKVEDQRLKYIIHEVNDDLDIFLN